MSKVLTSTEVKKETSYIPFIKQIEKPAPLIVTKSNHEVDFNLDSPLLPNIELKPMTKKCKVEKVKKNKKTKAKLEKTKEKSQNLQVEQIELIRAVVKEEI